MSMPRSRITRTALGCRGLGWLPALAASTRAPPSRSRIASAIWERELLPVHRNSTRTGGWAGVQRTAPLAASAPPGPAAGRGAARRRLRQAARGTRPGRGCSRCRARRPSCAAWSPARPRAVGRDGRTSGSAAGRPAPSARGPAGRCAPAHAATATAPGARPDEGIRTPRPERHGMWCSSRMNYINLGRSINPV